MDGQRPDYLLDIGCATIGSEESIEALLDRFAPVRYLGFDPNCQRAEEQRGATLVSMRRRTGSLNTLVAAKPAIVTACHGMTVCCGGTPRTVKAISRIDPFVSSAMTDRNAAASASGADPMIRDEGNQWSPIARSTKARCDAPAQSTIAGWAI